MRLVFLAALLTFPLLAQSTPDAFLARLPSPPQNPCGMKGQQRGDFSQKVDEALRDMDVLSQKLDERNDEAMQGKEAEARAKALKSAGLSEAEAARIENMSDKELDAMIAGKLKGTTGLTLAEVKKAEGMNPEELKAQTTAQASAGKLTPKAGVPKAGMHLSTDEQREMQTLRKDAMGRDLRIQMRYAQLEKELAATPRPAPKRGYTPPEGAVDPVCKAFAERYLVILADHLASTQKAVKETARIEALTAKQLGMASLPGAGKGGLGAVQNYAQRLRDVFRFDR